MATTSTTRDGITIEQRKSPLTLVREYWVWIAVVLLALLPFVGGQTGLISNYSFLQLNLMMMFAIAVLGLNLLTGFNGQISLGHGAFLCIGGYVTAVLMAYLSTVSSPVSAATSPTLRPRAQFCSGQCPGSTSLTNSFG